MKLSPECQERQALKVAYTKVASAIEVQLQLYSAAKPASGNRFREKQFRIGQRDVGKPCALENSQAKVFHKPRTGVGSLVTEMNVSSRYSSLVIAPQSFCWWVHER